MDPLSGLTLAAPAGINAYVPLLTVALAQYLGWVNLRAPYDVLGRWWVIAIIALLLLVEIVADKIPVVDHANDAIQTVVRPAVGGLLAVSASGQGWVSPALLVVGGVLIAGGVHTVKASARPVINASTAGAGSPIVSTIEDIGAFGMTILALMAPLLAFAVLAAGVVAAVLVIRRWRDRRAVSVE
jgi:uncharacterized membrane protein